jgi:hypothetical protein
MARLTSLRLEAVGGILLVGTLSDPYIVVVAAPALATLGLVDTTNPPGSSFLDFWDDTVLSPFGLPVYPALQCPLMVAAKGVSQKVKLTGIVDFMKDYQPLFFSCTESKLPLLSRWDWSPTIKHFTYPKSVAYQLAWFGLQQ